MPTSSGPKILGKENIVAMLDGADIKSYPGSGTTWYDLSGNGNNGSISNGEFISNGKYLQNSGGTSNFFVVNIPNSTSISNTFSVTTGGWTIEEIIWTNSTNYPEADGGSVASDSAYGGGATGFDWNHGIGIGTFQFGQSSNSSAFYEDSPSVTVPSPYNQFSTWRMRTIIWNRTNNTNSLYINGTLIGTVSTPNTAGTSIYDGGGINFGSLYGWKHFGRRARIKIYNKALTAQEVRQNYQQYKTRFNLS